MARNVINLPVIALSESAQVFFRVGPLVGDAEVPVFAAASGGSALVQPILSGATGGYSVYFGDYDGDVWIHYGANTPFNSSVYRTELTTARAYVSRGSYEPIVDSGSVSGGTSFTYSQSNVQDVTFSNLDCALTWTALPAAGNRGSMAMITTTGPVLPSTLGSGQGDWQVKMLANLTINSVQEWELWVDDATTIKIAQVTPL